jgi:UDPglucose 6-dehydrogenase
VERPVRKSNLVFSTDIEGCVREADMVVVCVETPKGKEGEGGGVAADTTALENVVGDVARWGTDGVILVVKSTVTVGMAGRIREMVKLS